MKNTFTFPISRGQENLFVYRKTETYDRLDNNGFVVKRLSPETESLSEKSAQAEENKDKTPWYATLISAAVICLSLPIGLLVNVFYSDFFGAWGEAIFFFSLLTLWRISRRIEAKFKPSDKQRAILLKSGMIAVRAELGIPEAAREIDVLPYVYKETKKGLAPTRKDGSFENTPVCIWRDGDDLCLSDEDALVRIPVKAIVEMREVARKIHVSAWYKAYTVDSPNYKPYAKQNFWAGVNVLSYLEVEIKGDGESKYLLLPNYDAPIFRKLADPTRPL